jgi:antitoxin CptB
MTTPLPGIDRLRWQCRRGMLELDHILQTFVDARYESLPEEGKRRFLQLLEHADPDIHAWILGEEKPPRGELAALIEEIREVVSGRSRGK